MVSTQGLSDGGGGLGLLSGINIYAQSALLLAFALALIGFMDQHNFDSRFFNANYIFNLLDLAATGVFAASAATVAVSATTDMQFGARRDAVIIASAFLTGNGGGTARDLLSMQPVFWMDAVVYAVLSIAIGYFAARFSMRCSSKMKRILSVLDHFSTGIFAASGVLIAMRMLEPHETGFLFLACCMGTVTAVGGGVIRDIVILRRIPMAVRTPYGIVALFGSFCQGLAIMYMAPTPDTPIGFIWLIGTFATFVAAELTRQK